MTGTLTQLDTHRDIASYNAPLVPRLPSEIARAYFYRGLLPALAGQNSSVESIFSVDALFDAQGIDGVATGGWGFPARVNRIFGIVQPRRLAHERAAKPSPEQSIVREFTALPEVAAVYLDRIQAEWVCLISVSGDQYDDALMDRLLDREVKLLDLFPHQAISFRYLPDVPGAECPEYISDSARILFQRYGRPR